MQTLLMDGKFKKVKPYLPEVLVDATVAREHASVVERRIQTIKEQVRGITCTLPYQKCQL